jgi:hypothetical protein
MWMMRDRPARVTGFMTNVRPERPSYPDNTPPSTTPSTWWATRRTVCTAPSAASKSSAPPARPPACGLSLGIARGGKVHRPPRARSRLGQAIIVEPFVPGGQLLHGHRSLRSRGADRARSADDNAGVLPRRAGGLPSWCAVANVHHSVARASGHHSVDQAQGRCRVRLHHYL